MRYKKSLQIILIMVALLVSILAVPAFADAGNFSGHSDFGGSSSGSSGGSWGGTGALGLLALGSSGGSGGGLIFVIIVAYVFFKILKNRKNTTTVGSFATAYSDLMPIQSIRDNDPNFSEAAMKEKIANLYVQMQDAWQNKKFETMRPYMTDTLYNQFARQLEELIRAENTNYIERIAVLDVNLSGWRSDEVNDAVVALVNTRIIDYTVDDKTGKVISGSKNAEKFMCYEWTLIRSKGVETPAASGEGSEGTATIHCPSCGAPLEMNQSAKCPYCGSIIYANDFDWSISSIKGVSQETKY